MSDPWSNVSVSGGASRWETVGVATAAGMAMPGSGWPLPLRLRHRAALRGIVGEIVRGCMDRRAAFAHIAARADANIEPTDDREPFREMAERDVLGLHEGNYARHRITPAEFDAWRRIWTEGAG